MLQVSTIKFDFRIRTRQALVVENLMIHGRDEADAERKLRQMHLNCQILAKSVQSPNPKKAPMSFEEVVTLVTK